MTMCGTLEFMAPEVMDCKFASTASDMWGVGSIAYLLLSGGKSPFWGGNRYIIIKHIKNLKLIERNF